MEIICPDHGSFFQRKDSHLSGSKCKLCRNKESTGKFKYTTESYVEQLRVIYGDSLIFDKTLFKGTSEKVVVTCPVHGDYSVYAAPLLKGYSCKKCSGDKQRTTVSEFRTKAALVHSGYYDYSLCSEITKSKQKVTIVCPRHGQFYQSYNSHLAGKGCRKCSDEDNVQPRKITNEQFIERCVSIHGDKYDYSLVSMDGVNNNVTIICPVHGEYNQPANCHLTGRGCRFCRNDTTTYDMVSRYTKNQELGGRIGSLYIAEMIGESEAFIKIGITSNWKGRLKQYNKVRDVYTFNLLCEFEYKNIQCAKLERELFRFLKSLNLKYKPLHNFNGRSECFIKESLKVALEFIEGYSFERG